MVMLSSGKLDLKPNVILFNNIVFSLRLKTHEVFIKLERFILYSGFIYKDEFIQTYISIRITICSVNIVVTKWSCVYWLLNSLFKRLYRKRLCVSSIRVDVMRWDHKVYKNFCLFQQFHNSGIPFFEFW
jgi:hypothetical protein